MGGVKTCDALAVFGILWTGLILQIGQTLEATFYASTFLLTFIFIVCFVQAARRTTSYRILHSQQSGTGNFVKLQDSYASG